MQIEDIKGIGPKATSLLHKLNIYETSDLLTYFPFRYNVLKKSDLNSAKQDENIVIDGRVKSIPRLYFYGRRMDKMTFQIESDSLLINVVIYNRGFLKSNFVLNDYVTLIGKYDLKHNLLVANDIRFYKLPEKPLIEPVYHLTYGLSNKSFQKYINSVIFLDIALTDYIPKELASKYHFVSKDMAIKVIHQPNDEKTLKQAILRLKYEEFFLFMLKMQYLKNQKEKDDGIARNISRDNIDSLAKTLPFTLTLDQLKCITEILNDLNSPKRMNRLLQGDVGSGKTIVAFFATYFNYLSGYQTAFMAPTEILALQHYENLKQIFKNYDIKIACLTGKMKAQEKKAILENLKTGQIDVLVGTHTLFQKQVEYKNLGLVITDEQHRFGVNQRTTLKGKGKAPDMLAMSATPIPRTYALTIYGDMDISNIKTLPSGRKKITTILKSESDIKDVLAMMLEQLKAHHQIYVIAPLIEESDKTNQEDVMKLTEKMQKAFGKFYKVGTLHGKLSSSEKDKIMTSFKNNEIQILISTTVIEVGIDVKNATMMVIFDSYRFGLSTIHQLRGRVGRNDLDSYCILISNRETERLKILTEYQDGFTISEKDFELRGSGDLFGLEQSGEMIFKLANIKKDYQILVKAKEDCEEFLKLDGATEYLEAIKFKEIMQKIADLD